MEIEYNTWKQGERWNGKNIHGAVEVKDPRIPKG